MCENSVEATLHRTLLSRHTAQSRLSHYEGSPEELRELARVAWLFAGSRPGKLPDTVVLSGGIPPTGFFSKDGATRTTHGMLKPEAVRVDIIVLITKRGACKGAAEIQVIDFQAWDSEVWETQKARSAVAA
ncbi:MAG: hypothetical protein WC725_00075 [Patescibacteria group bacterium]|jgi:hypothetical protein